MITLTIIIIVNMIIINYYYQVCISTGVTSGLTVKMALMKKVVNCFPWQGVTTKWCHRTPKIR